MSVPGNQMFVKFETSSKVTRVGFKAFIHKIGTNLSHQNKFLENFKSKETTKTNFYILLQMIIASIGRT